MSKYRPGQHKCLVGTCPARDGCRNAQGRACSPGLSLALSSPAFNLSYTQIYENVAEKSKLPMSAAF